MDGATLITVCSLVNGYGFMQVTFKKASFGRFTASYKVSKSLEFNGEVKEYRKGKQVSKSDFSCYEFYQVI